MQFMLYKFLIAGIQLLTITKATMYRKCSVKMSCCNILWILTLILTVTNSQSTCPSSNGTHAYL